MVGSNTLKLSLVLRELAVLLLDLLHFLFGAGYLVGVPNSCFL
jgi:hypothetical protein